MTIILNPIRLYKITLVSRLTLIDVFLLHLLLPNKWFVIVRYSITTCMYYSNNLVEFLITSNGKMAKRCVIAFTLRSIFPKSLFKSQLLTSHSD